MFLGSLAVAPRDDFKRWFESKIRYGVSDMDAAMRQSLQEVFPLPSIDSVTEHQDGDLVLDVVVLHFQSGSTFVLDSGVPFLPIFWRPRVEVKSRLYKLKTGETVQTFAAKQKMPWREFTSRSLNPELAFGISQPFDSNDLKVLLYKACLKLLEKMDKAVKKGL